MTDQDRTQLTIPYIAYESMLAKEDTQQRRMVYIIIMLIVLLVVTNLIWLVAWNQYDYVDEDYSTKVDLDGGNGNANYIGNDGDIYNGESNSTNDTQDENQDAQ